MNDHDTKPTFELHVYGDWHTVIGVREYRDALINQKPFDEDDAVHNRYTLRFEKAKDIFAAYQAFSAARLQCELAVHAKSPIGVDVWATTETGYMRHGGPCMSIDVDEAKINERLSRAIKEAQDALSMREKDKP